MKRSDANHKANQANGNNAAYHKVNDNRSNQGNPRHPTYAQGRTAAKTAKAGNK